MNTQPKKLLFVSPPQLFPWKEVHEIHELANQRSSTGKSIPWVAKNYRIADNNRMTNKLSQILIFGINKKQLITVDHIAANGSSLPNHVHGSCANPKLERSMRLFRHGPPRAHSATARLWADAAEGGTHGYYAPKSSTSSRDAKRRSQGPTRISVLESIASANTLRFGALFFPMPWVKWTIEGALHW